MNRTFKETPNFTRKWYEAGLTDDDLIQLQNVLLDDPKAGRVIRGTGGIRKIRIPLDNTGKRGGGRVLYVDVEVKETIHLLDVYVKNMKDDLSSAERKALRILVNILREED